MKTAETATGDGALCVAYIACKCQGRPLSLLGAHIVLCVLHSPTRKWLAIDCRGILPAVSGQFVSHGLRTFAYEGSLNIMKAVTGGAAELQVRCLALSHP